MLLRWLVGCASLGTALGHMNLLYPLPINSKNDPQTPEAQKDYSYTAPLDKTGSNWPAKLYATQETFDRLEPVATLVAGENFKWTLEGTATHNGGSCQVAISYDLLKTVAVMASWVGGCPLDKGYTFKVPDIPGAKKALFWWSWFNRTGNREMYNNVAVVAVTGTAKSFTGPTPYRANTFPDGTCINTEGVDQLFPNPGLQVIYGGDYKGQTPTGGEVDGCSYDVSSDVTVSSDGSSAPPPADTADKGGDSTTTTDKATTAPAGEATSPATGANKTTSAKATTSTAGDDEDTDVPTPTGGAGSTTKSSAGSGTPTPTATGSSAGSTTDGDLIAGYTTKEVGFGAVILISLALLGVVLCSAMGHKRRRGSSSRASKHRKKKKHRYEKAQKEDTATESSATGSDESTDGFSDEEKSRKGRRR